MSGFSINSADRCLAILELLADKPSGLTLGEVAQRVELAASATHRLLAVLKARRYVRQSGANERYSPTLRLAAMGLQLAELAKVYDLCQPILDDLAEKTGELVRMSVVEDSELIWTSKAQGSRSNIRYDPLNGRTLPYYATAAGKAWLATLSDKEATRVVETQGFPSIMVGPKAPKSLKVLRDQLRVTRDQGFGLVEEELENDISAIAVTIGGAASREPVVFGCLSVGGPSFRLSRERLISFLPNLRSAADSLGEIWPVLQREELQA